MKASENVTKICESLQYLGHGDVSNKILEALWESTDDPLAVISLALDSAVTTTKNKIFKERFSKSKLGDPIYIKDLLNYKVRQLDLEYIQNLASLGFIRDRRNVVIYGPPGTGKTWLSKALATRACQEGYKARWVTYPFLCRELMRLKKKDTTKYESRLKYYCKYSVLCIDEFPNCSIEDKYIMQEFFNYFKTNGHSCIVCSQCNPDNWDTLFEIKSFAQSIKGRLLEQSYRLELKGPDLRFYVPDKE